MIALLVIACSLAVALVLPVLSFVRASRAEREVRRLTLELVALRRMVDGLRSEFWQDEARGNTVAAAPLRAAETAVPSATTDAAWRDTVSGRQRPPDAVTAPDVAQPSVQVPPWREAASGVPTSGADDLEQRIGGRWLLYAGMAALVLGISYFVKFAFDNGWVSEPLRVIVGLAAGGALVMGGVRCCRQGLPLFGHVLAGGGIVVVYIALYAALHVYQLTTPGAAFSTLVLVTGFSAYLADRERAQALAVVALVGGFATPFLVGGDLGAQPVLFTYIALLLTGTTILGLRHAWPLLHLVAFVLTCVTVAVWWGGNDGRAPWLRTQLFLTFYAALFVYTLFAVRRQAEASPVARVVMWTLAAAPVLYHVASLVLVASHPGALLVYFVLFTVTGLSISYHTDRPWLRTVVLVLAGLPLMAWMDGLRRPGWYAGALITTCAIYGLHLAGQWRALSDDDAPTDAPVAEILHTHLNGVWLPTALYLFLEDRAAWWNPPMLTALAAWNAGIAWAIRLQIPTLPWHMAALAATLAAVAIGVWFDGPAVAVGWAMEGAAIGWLAISRGSRWLGAGSAALFVLATLRLLEMLARPLAVTSWPVLNTRSLAAALVIGVGLWVAATLRRAATEPTARHVLIVGAHVLAIAWLSAELHAVFGQRAYLAAADDRPVGVARAELFEQVALSVAWGCYAVALIALGMVRGYAPARYLGIALFGVTIVKVVTRDIAELDRVHQMLSVPGVGGLLLLASFLYQRMARRDAPPAAGSAAGPAAGDQAVH